MSFFNCGCRDCGDGTIKFFNDIFDKQTNSDDKNSKFQSEKNHNEMNNVDSESVCTSMGKSSLNTNIYNLNPGSEKEYSEIP